MRENLSSYVQDAHLGVEIVLVEDLAPAIERISKILPSSVIWDIFSSSPSDTSGKITFPYCRVDTAFIAASDYIYLLTQNGDTYDADKRREFYNKGCALAFKALVWVEIGFGGLQKFAESPASQNWTYAVGRSSDPTQRERAIMTTGKREYIDCMSRFAALRTKRGISDDYFSQYSVEYLLDTVTGDS